VHHWRPGSHHGNPSIEQDKALAHGRGFGKSKVIFAIIFPERQGIKFQIVIK
jgi:hypothetical protein